MYGHTEAKEKWEDQLQYFQESTGYKEFFGIDGELIEFEWNIFPGHTTMQLVKEVKTDSSSNKRRSNHHVHVRHRLDQAGKL